MYLLDFRLYSSVFVHMYVLFAFGCVCICICSLQCLVHCLLELGGGVSPRLYMHQTPISGLPTMAKIKLYRNIGIIECSSSSVVYIHQYIHDYIPLCNCAWNTPFFSFNEGILYKQVEHTLNTLFCPFSLTKILSHREKKNETKMQETFSINEGNL